MGNTVDVKLQNHFKLYILFKDYMAFENELQKKNINYCVDYNQANIQKYRYFLLHKDKEIIDLILKENNLYIQGFLQMKKGQSLYFKVALVVVILFVLITLLVDFFKS